MTEKAAEVKKQGMELEIDVPDGVEVDIEGTLVKVRGGKGESQREFPVNNLGVVKKGDKIILTCSSNRRREKALLGTTNAHITNMIHGVSEGIVYKMKIVYSHFPMNVKAQGDRLVIDNFFGEKCPRKAKILEGVDVEIKGQEVTLKGINKERVSQTAANIEQATKIKNRDRRVFQDGIYIIEKDGRSLVR